MQCFLYTIQYLNIGICFYRFSKIFKAFTSEFIEKNMEEMVLGTITYTIIYM